MIEIRPISLGAIDFVARHICPDEAECYREMTGHDFDAGAVAALLYAAGGRAWTFYETVDRCPVAVGGYTCVRPGVWQSWFMGTPLAWQKGSKITERVAEVVQNMFVFGPTVQRLETVTLATRTRARAWYEQIGLHYESTACKASASGQDLVTYAALRTA